MKLVVFGVVLILPAVLSADFSSGFISDCDGYIEQGGGSVCGMRESHYSGYDPKTCTVTCTDGTTVKLPDGVCSHGDVECTPEVEKKIADWNLKMQADFQKYI
uniref:Putative secreted protein n=1 Tax=Ixodes ricinus TaxID=34613 RepID=V5GY52_IXORI